MKRIRAVINNLKNLFQSLLNLWLLRRKLRSIKRLVFEEKITKNFSEILPIAFVGQPEYFRQNYFDALDPKVGFEFEIKSGDLSAINRLSDFIDEKQCKAVVFFRPEWLAQFPDVWTNLTKKGIALIGFSTEPIPTNWKINQHPDQWLRLGNLVEARKVPYDLVIHFDQESKEVFESIGFARTLYNALPVSSKLFFPMNTSKKYDACFIGRSTEHREAFLMPLKARYNIIHIAHGVFDEEANEIINLSRICINLHNQPYKNFETRAVQALRARTVLVSEPLSGALLRPGIDYIEVKTPGELYETIKDLLQSGNWQKNNPAPTSNLEIFDMKTLILRINSTLSK